MRKKRRLTIDFREMRSEFTQESIVNKWRFVNVKMVDHLISLQDFLEQHSQRHGHALHQETQLQSHTAEH